MERNIPEHYIPNVVRFSSLLGIEISHDFLSEMEPEEKILCTERYTPGTDTGITIPVLNTANTGKNQSGIQYRYSVPGKKQSGTQYRYSVPGKIRAVLNTGI
jgi:hypothetical protein